MSIRLDNVRLAFPALYEPRAFAGNEDSAKYSASFLFPKTDTVNLNKVRNEIIIAAKNKWADKADQVLAILSQQNRTCLRDGDGKTDYDGFPDCFYVTASNQAKPIIIGLDKTPLTKDSGKPYAGCMVNCSIDIWAMDNKFGKRINATLRGVQFAGDGDAFSGSAPATPDEFDSIASPKSDADGLF
jgi:hypothetical protein